MRKTFILLGCLAALAGPRAGSAYPDSGASYAVQAGGSAWTVLRDDKDPMLWHYLPATALVRSDKTRQPELGLLKMQLLAEGGELIDAAALLISLNLQPAPAVKTELARAVAALEPMKERGAAAGSIRLACVTLHDARLTLLDGEAGAVASGGADPSITPVLDPYDVSFTVTARGAGAQRLSALLLGKEGLGLSVDYSYTAGPVPASASGKASGTAGLAAYPKETADKAVTVLPPGLPEYGFLKLPQADAGQDLTSIAYTVTLQGPDGKMLPNIPAQTVQWRPNEGWRDQKGNPRRLLLMPLKGVYASGLKPATLRYKLEASLTRKGGTLGKMEKATAAAPLLTDDLPLAAPATPFKAVRLSAEYLTFGGEGDLAAVTTQVKCGKEVENAAFKSDREGSLVPAPATVFFSKDCGNISLTAGYLRRGGKRENAVIPVEDGKSLVYLAEPKN